MKQRLKLPAPVAAIYRAVAELEATYPLRKFTPGGHLVGSIGEVIAAEASSLTLHPASHPGHDAFDSAGNVKIKMTAGNAISLYSTCDRLVVLRVISPEEAEIVYTMAAANLHGNKLAQWARTVSAASESADLLQSRDAGNQP